MYCRFVTDFSINKCNVSQLDYAFLTGTDGDALTDLSLFGCSNIGNLPNVATTNVVSSYIGDSEDFTSLVDVQAPLLLSGLTHFGIWNCPKFSEWDYSIKWTGLEILYLNNIALDDETVANILDTVLESNQENPMMALTLSLNRLTVVPQQIRSLHKLRRLLLANNYLSSVKSGSFNFSLSSFAVNEQPISLDITYNSLTIIEVGAFQGSYLYSKR